MSFLIRQVDRRFSATSALGGSFYNMFLTVAIAVVLMIFFKSDTDPTQLLFIPVFCGIWIIFITLLALTLDSNVLLACEDLSRPLRRLLNPSKDSLKRTSTETISNPENPETPKRSHSSTMFVVNREMFPSKYETFNNQLLEKILEELNFQRAAVRRALVTGSSTGQSTAQLPDIERHRLSTQIDVTKLSKSKPGSTHTDDLSPRADASPRDALKVVIDAPIANVEVEISSMEKEGAVSEDSKPREC